MMEHVVSRRGQAIASHSAIERAFVMRLPIARQADHHVACLDVRVVDDVGTTHPRDHG